MLFGRLYYNVAFIFNLPCNHIFYFIFCNSNLIDHIHALGVEDASFSNLRKSTVDVLLDGCVIGHANFAVANKAAYKLREMKVMGINGIPETLEIALVEPSPGSIYPGNEILDALLLPIFFSQLCIAG